MSAAATYRGDASLNPEQLLVASLSACQALTCLFLAARTGVAVVAYADEAEGTPGLIEGRVRMARVALAPGVLKKRRNYLRRAGPLSTRPGFAPVSAPPRMIGTPFTTTWWIPSGYWWGSV